MFRPIVSSEVLLALPLFAIAGYEQPSFIDGSQSMDGRFIVTVCWP